MPILEHLVPVLKVMPASALDLQGLPQTDKGSSLPVVSRYSRWRHKEKSSTLQVFMLVIIDTVQIHSISPQKTHVFKVWSQVQSSG